MRTVKPRVLVMAAAIGLAIYPACSTVDEVPPASPEPSSPGRDASRREHASRLGRAQRDLRALETTIGDTERRIEGRSDEESRLVKEDLATARTDLRRAWELYKDAGETEWDISRRTMDTAVYDARQRIDDANRRIEFLLENDRRRPR
jgi:hypothetical protein